MAGDAARLGPPKLGKPFDRRKKRKLKKKRAAKDTTDPALPSLETTPKLPEPEPEFTSQPLVPMSPRKQTLMRHKKSDTTIGEPLFVSEVKELKKNRRSLPPAPAVESEYGKFSLDLSNQNIEDKVTLFKCPSARIVVFHEQLVDSTANALSGTLLGHGDFEIFQLHNGDVTYLACGRSFVYPLLPKLKMLRTDKNHFVLPLLNPQRYWKIHIDSGDAQVLGNLETVLKKVVNYTNLSLLESASETAPSTALDDSSDGQKSAHFTPLFQDIPESPPSAPASPNNLNLFVQDNFQLLPPRKPAFNVLRKKSNQSINSALASFSLADPSRKLNSNGNTNGNINGLTKYNLHHPTPVTHANPYRKGSKAVSDHHSDLSSMDSLLDEYEENISTTKSINFNISRPQSRAVSITSSTNPAPVQYHRGKVALLPDRMSNIGSHYGTVEEEEEMEDEFPKTSLSHYNRTRQNSRSVRSRKSSVSELYSSVSNWMEPGTNKTKLIHSKSNYSLASKQSTSRPPTLNDTYREIYRSITLHNLSLIASGREKDLRANGSLKKSNNKQNPSKSAAGPYYSKLLISEQVDRKTGKQAEKEKQDGLSPNEVYRLLSSREQRPGPEKASGIGRFFGW